jgi:hypothetical protein
MDTNYSIERLQQLLRSATAEGVEESLAISHDFFETSDYDQMAAIEAQFCVQHQAIVAHISTVWGAPRFQGNWNDDEFPHWAATEAILLSYWDRPDASVAYVAVVKHDKELPYFLVLGAKKLNIFSDDSL